MTCWLGSTRLDCQPRSSRLSRPRGGTIAAVQIAYLSNRPNVLAGTLRAVEQWMPWVTEALVCGPSNSQSRLLGLATESITITLVEDSQVSGLSPVALQSLDHVSRNVTLRRAMLDNGLLAASFILSDDDYRPLADIPITDFVHADGRHQGFWFHRLEDWPANETAYDRAQTRTLAILRLLGVDTLAYGAHMPQVMHAPLLSEAFEAADDVGAGALLDEWSLYFNVASARHPEQFAAPLPFRTLAWPAWPHQWEHVVTPHPIRFENHYPEHEEAGGLFSNLPPVTTAEGALERIARWRAAEIAIGELRFDPAWNDPWTRGSANRRRSMAALRMAAKVRKYVNFGS